MGETGGGQLGWQVCGNQESNKNESGVTRVAGGGGGNNGDCARGDARGQNARSTLSTRKFALGKTGAAVVPQ